MGTTAIAGAGDGTGQPAVGDGKGADAAAAGSGTEGGHQGSDKATLDRSKLNPVLQTLEPEQLNELFNTLLTGLQRPPAAEAVPTPVPEPKPLDKAALKEMMDPTSDKFDPEKAVGMIADRNYRPLIGEINKRALSGTFARFGREFPDFDQAVPEIEKTFKGRDPTTISEADVFGVYLTWKGLQIVQKEQAEKAKQKGATTVQPSAPKVETGKVELTELETNVAKRMFPNSKNPVADYVAAREKMDSGMQLKVPTGRDAAGKVTKE